MSLAHTASLPSILSLLLLGACVAKEPDSLGDLETGTDEGATESAGDSDGGSTSDPSASSGETGEPNPCPDPDLVYNEPPCAPQGALPVLPAAGCYEPCNGPGAACLVGQCAQVQVDPCACADGGDCCELCGAVETWLCVEAPLPDAVCEAIVGTTFSSVEELECGLGPDGPVPCHWQIVFEEDGDYLWQYSDIGEGGTYACIGGVITIQNNPGLDVAYDVATGILSWDGVQYVAEPT